MDSGPRGAGEAALAETVKSACDEAGVRWKAGKRSDSEIYPSHFELGPYSARLFSTWSPNFMSQHRSLKGASTIAAKRNVLKRFERVEVLKKRGQFKAGDKVIGLKKTKPDE